MKKLSRQFFKRPTLEVARDLLGKYLVRNLNGEIIKAKIIETEAYCGEEDKACHASKGLTPRTKVMYGPAGHAYIYMIYGVYHCLNIVTEKEGHPAAVLVRGAEVSKIHNTRCKILDTKLIGPGKLCRELKISKKLNGTDLIRSREIWIEDVRERPKKVIQAKRIGVDYAGEWKDKLWRFVYIK